MGKFKLGLLAGVAFALLPFAVQAQSTATPVLPGLLTNVGCHPGETYCWAPYSNTNPLSITGSISASLAGFSPTAGATVALASSGTSADAALPAGTDVVVTNPSSTVTAFFRIQAGAGTALATDQPILPGAAIGIHVGTATHISAITGGSSVTLQIQGGSGLAAGYGGGSSSGGGTTNITQINGTTALAGAGATGAGSLRTTTAQDTSTVAGAAPLTTGIYVTGASAAALSTSANQATEISSLATIATNSGSAIPAGTALIGKVGVDQTTPGTTNAVQSIAGATGGATPFYLTAANSTNATNVKASAGTLYDADLSNNSATPAYVSFYNNAGTPTCGTGIVYQMMIPANSTSGAGWVSKSHVGLAFSTGIAICIATGIAGTGSVAASAYTISLGFK